MEQPNKHPFTRPGPRSLLLVALSVAMLPLVAAASGGPSTRPRLAPAPGMSREQVRAALGSRVEQMRERRGTRKQRGGARGHNTAGQPPAPPPRDPLPRPSGDLLN